MARLAEPYLERYQRWSPDPTVGVTACGGAMSTGMEPDALPAAL